MKLPFTADAFLNVFRQYNNAIWPLQIFFYLLALIAVFLAVKRTAWSNRAISFILSFFWLWMGVVYHLIFFTAINNAAYIFSALFIIQGLLFLFYGVFTNRLAYYIHMNAPGITGLILVLFSLVFYPAIGYTVGHVYPYNPTFGLPCPTTIFTLGLLVWTFEKSNSLLFIIPLLWSLIGFTAAFRLGIIEDSSLLLSGLMTLLLLLLKNKKAPPEATVLKTTKAT
jgi:hypothetical protein